MKSEITVETMKAAPPVAISVAATAQGWTLSDWVAVATIVYIVMQVGYLGWKWWREIRTPK